MVLTLFAFSFVRVQETRKKKLTQGDSNVGKLLLRTTADSDLNFLYSVLRLFTGFARAALTA